MSIESIFNFLREKTPDVVSVMATKPLTAAGDYNAEDVLSESAVYGTPYIFTGMAKKDGGSGEIQKAIAFCSVTALTPRITLYLFNQRPTSNLLDNVANAAPSVTDHPSFEGQIDFTALEDLGGGSSSVVTANTSGNLPLPYKCHGTSLFGIAVLRDAVTGEAKGMLLSFKLQARRD